MYLLSLVVVIVKSSQIAEAVLKNVFNTESPPILLSRKEVHVGRGRTRSLVSPTQEQVVEGDVNLVIEVATLGKFIWKSFTEANSSSNQMLFVALFLNVMTESHATLDSLR